MFKGLFGRSFDKKKYSVRILHNLGANAISQGINILGQLLTVPIFLYFWGKELYGEWILLSTIPAYFAMSDVGFACVGATDMTVLVARNDRAAALEVFQSIWILISSVSLLLLSALAVVSVWAPIDSWLNITHLSHEGSALIVLLLLCQTAVSQQTGLLQAGFRCEGAAALGQHWHNLIRLAELLITAAVVAAKGSPLVLVLAILVVRLAGTALMRVHLYRICPWLTFGWQYARFNQIRRLAGPSFALMIFPLGHALKNQGFVIVVGRFMGPVEVVLFTTARTLTNAAFQLMVMINHSVWPEMSAAFGVGDLPLARAMHRHTCRASLWAAGCLVAGLSLFGPWIYQIWVRREVALDTPLFHILLAATLANALWYTSLVVSLAINQHQRTALYYLFGTGVGLLIAVLMVPTIGLLGAGFALLAIDAMMLGLVLPNSLALVQDRFLDFVRVVVRPPLAWRGGVNW